MEKFFYVEPVTKTPEVLGAINELVGISFEEYLAPNQKAKKLGAKVISVINVVQVSPDIYKKLMNSQWAKSINFYVWGEACGYLVQKGIPRKRSVKGSRKITAFDKKEWEALKARMTAIEKIVGKQ